MRAFGRLLLASVFLICLMVGGAFVPEIAGFEPWPLIIPVILACTSIVGILAIACVARFVPKPEYLQVMLMHLAGLWTCFVAVVFFNVMAAIWLPVRDAQSGYLIIVVYFFLLFPIIRLSEFVFFGARLKQRRLR